MTFLKESNQYETILVGAGLSAVTYALMYRRQKGSFEGLVLLEKSKGLGGRYACRRVNDFLFNHGIWWVQRDLQKELTRIFPRWSEHLSTFPQKDAWQFKGGANDWFKRQSGLPVQRQSHVDFIRFDHRKDLFEVRVNGESTLKSSKVILSCPAPQSLQILRESAPELIHDDVFISLEKIQYEKRIVIFLEGDQATDWSAQLELSNTSLKKNGLIREQGERQNKSYCIFEYSGSASEELFKRKDEMKDTQLWEDKYLPAQCLSFQAWRYAFPRTNISEHYLHDRQKRLGLIGDWGPLERPSLNSLTSAQKLFEVFEKA